MRIASTLLHVLSSADDKEGGRRRQPIQAGEMNVSAIHDLAGARLGQEIIPHADIADVCRSHANKAGNRDPQVQQGVHLQGGFAAWEGVFGAQGNNDKHRSMVVESSA